MDDEFDAEVAAIFTEEATELLEAADHSLQGWRGDRGNNQNVHELKRALHTLKGGARMAGIRAMGDLSHELESFMELVEHGGVPATSDVFELLQTSLDELNHMRDTVNQGRPVRSARYLMERIKALGRGQLLPAAPPPAIPATAPVPEQPALQSAQMNTDAAYLDVVETETTMSVEPLSEEVIELVRNCRY
jgi:chemosensory pili system protein ChpA (sensor histidine kinase/response regulator)